MGSLCSSEENLQDRDLTAADQLCQTKLVDNDFEAVFTNVFEDVLKVDKADEKEKQIWVLHRLPGRNPRFCVQSNTTVNAEEVKMVLDFFAKDGYTININTATHGSPGGFHIADPGNFEKSKLADAAFAIQDLKNILKADASISLNIMSSIAGPIYPEQAQININAWCWSNGKGIIQPGKGLASWKDILIEYKLSHHIQEFENQKNDMPSTWLQMTDGQLRNASTYNFADTDITKWEKMIDQMQRERWTTLLKENHLGMFVDVFQEMGYDDIACWNDLTQEDLTLEFGFSGGQLSKWNNRIIPEINQDVGGSTLPDKEELREMVELDLPAGKAFICGAHGQNLGVKPDGTLYVTPNKLDWEMWRLEHSGDGAYFICGAHGKNLGVKPDGTGLLAHAVKLDLETWRIEHSGDGAYFICGAHGKNLGVKPDGTLYVDVNKGGWEKWRLEEYIYKLDYYISRQPAINGPWPTNCKCVRRQHNVSSLGKAEDIAKEFIKEDPEHAIVEIVEDFEWGSWKYTVVKSKCVEHKTADVHVGAGRRYVAFDGSVFRDRKRVVRTLKRDGFH